MMKDINNQELNLISGGISVSGSLINSFSSAITKILEVGRSLGTAIRRVANKKICAIR